MYTKPFEVTTSENLLCVFAVEFRARLKFSDYDLGVSDIGWTPKSQRTNNKGHKREAERQPHEGATEMYAVVSSERKNSSTKQAIQKS